MNRTAGEMRTGVGVIAKLCTFLNMRWKEWVRGQRCSQPGVLIWCAMSSLCCQFFPRSRHSPTMVRICSVQFTAVVTVLGDIWPVSLETWEVYDKLPLKLRHSLGFPEEHKRGDDP
jgi:hypothetical protein